MEAKKRVLAADDEPLWRERVRKAIEGLGHEAVVVDSAARASARMLDGESFDLLITDNWMEEMGAGVKLLQWLAKTDSDIPSILFTSDVSPRVAAAVPYPWVSIAKKDMWDTSDAKLVAEIRHRLP